MLRAGAAGEAGRLHDEAGCAGRPEPGAPPAVLATSLHESRDASRAGGVYTYTQRGEDSMKRLGIAALLALVAALVAAGTGASATEPRTITVSGTGIINTVPNQASFDFGVSTTGSTAQEALAANATRMNRVIDALKTAGLTAADLQTAQISLTPNTNQNGTVIINFSASNSVTATTSDIRKAGPIVDAAVAAGANLVSGPSLTESGQLLLTRQALAAAIANAHARAEAIAEAAGVRLGVVESVTEVSSSIPPIVPAEEARAAAPSTPIEAGTVQTEEDVSITYAIA